MHYSELAEIYEDLEKTTKKLKKRDIIAELFKKTPTDQLSEVVLLLTGSVFPGWSAEELGVANQLMIRAIAKAYGIKDKDVAKKFKTTGDLGLTAEHFVAKRKQRSLGRKVLTIERVFSDIQKISKQEGKGSQERKLGIIAGLLSSAKPKEARYIVRTVLGDLRVGVAEGIIKDAIAKAFDVEPKLVAHAWHLKQDYGEVARIARKSKDRGLGRIEIEISKPIAVLLGERSPDLKTALKSFEKAAVEVKYDGMRAQIQKKGGKIWVFTRRQENVTNQFPDIVEMCKKGLKAKECIVEGEVLGIDPKTKRPMPFQRLSQRIKRKYRIREMTKEIPVEIHLFDAVYINKKTLFDEKFSDRRKMLEKIVNTKVKGLNLAKQLVTKDLKKADKFYKESLKAGQEGVMVKNLDAKYVFGRKVAGGWIKVKPTLENLDLAIIGATWGTGKRAGWLGSFILGVRKADKFLECGMLGTGVKEKKTKPEDVTFAQLTKMIKPHIESEKGNKVKIKPKIIIEVAYEEIQRSPTYESKFALRFPRFIRLRPDKSPKQADDIKRMETIYKQQKGKRK